MSIEDRNYLIEKLADAVDSEHTASLCFGRLSDLIKNYKVRSNFIKFCESSKKNKELLLKLLSKLDESDFKLEEKCSFCKLNPESFSLFGALNLGLELTNVSMQFYDDLIKKSSDPKNKKIFKQLLTEKSRQKNFLKKEIKFVEDKSNSQLIVNYCVSEVVSKLGK